MREPTVHSYDYDTFVIVSTHGSLAGADLTISNVRRLALLFQLTAPLREPTRWTEWADARGYVSTHGSLAGADM